MSRILSFLSLCLVLFTTACSKDNPTPDPSLEGRWELQNAYIRYYALDGALIQDGKVSLPAVTEELLVTSTSLQFPTTFFGTAPGFFFSQLPYTRQGDTLTVTSPAISSYHHAPFVITDLTNDLLELQQTNNTILISTNKPALRVVGGRYSRKK